MPSEFSNPSPNTKEFILRQVREQVGPDQYKQLVNKFGEDSLIDLALESMEQNAGRSEPKTAGRLGGSIAGFIMGMLVGGIFLGASWLLNNILGVPHGYSLAALTNGAIITIPVGIFLTWRRTEEKKSIDFRMVFLYYTLASLIGGLMGVGRWLLHIEVSIMDTFVSPLWDTFYGCGAAVFVVGLVIAWILSICQISFNPDMLGIMGGPIFNILLVMSPIALLADTPLWKVGLLTLLNQNVVGVTLAVTVGVGCLLGLCWPPHLQENI